MKNFRILILSLIAIVTFSQRAGAKLSMSPQALGFVEGTLDFCAKADPNSADKYKAAGKAFVADATQEELDKARNSGEYKDSYDSTTSDLEKTPKEKAVKACTDFLAGK
jgi:hypothetical protein